MDINEYFKHKRDQYNILLKYIESGNDQNFESLNNYFFTQTISENNKELKSFLQMLLPISIHYCRKQFFLEQIKKIFLYLKEKIKQNFPKMELFDLCRENKQIILILLEYEIITLEDLITDINQNNDIDYICFFYPEIKDAINEKDKKNIDKKLSEYNSDIIQNFNIYRQKGENHSYLCSLIREDLIKEFVIYLCQNNINLSIFSIKPSIFETNSILKSNEKLTLIEYACFFGSIKIYQYLKHHVIIGPSLMIFAIHSRNVRLIHLVEQDIETFLTDEAFCFKCLEESIKCHHNEIAEYFVNKYFQKVNTFSLCLEYHNFHLILDNLKDTELSEMFYCSCKSNYADFLEILIEYKFEIDPEKAFENCNHYQDVMQFLLNHKIIGTEKFRGCTKITNLTIPSFIKEIEESSFEECTRLVQITIPSSVTIIEGYAFRNCSSLKQITIPSSVKEIHYGAFENCSSLEKIEIPKLIQVIESCLFFGCSSLKEVKIPISTKSIDSKAFYCCTSLEELIIPFVKEIGESAFFGCSSLKKLEIERLVKVEKCAFWGCSLINPESYPGLLDKCDKNSFDNCFKLSKIIEKSYPKLSNDKILNIDDYDIKKNISNNDQKSIFQATKKSNGEDVLITFYKKEFYNNFFFAFALTNIGIPGVIKVLNYRFLTKDLLMEEEEEQQHHLIIGTVDGIHVNVNYFGYISVEEFMDSAQFEESTISYLNSKSSIMNPTIRSKIIFGIAAIMSIIHGLDVIHQRLSMRSILLDQNFEPHITNFYHSGFDLSPSDKDALFNRARLKDAAFCSPELMLRRPVDVKSDVYSYAMILYFMFSVELKPDRELSAKNTLYKHIKNGHRFLKPENMPDHYWELIKMCWDPRPYNRPSFYYITDLLKDDIYALEEFGVKTDLNKLHEYQKKFDFI